MSNFEKVAELIAAQQKGKEGTAPWMVGEQLKDIARAEPASAELLAQDLTVAEMSLEKAAAQLQAYSDKNHKNAGCFVITPDVAEGILRKFYGLPEKGAIQKPAEEEPKVFSLADFLA